MGALAAADLEPTGTHALRRSAITAWANTYGLTNNQCADLAGNIPDVIERPYRKTNPVNELISHDNPLAAYIGQAPGTG